MNIIPMTINLKHWENLSFIFHAEQMLDSNTMAYNTELKLYSAQMEKNKITVIVYGMIKKI